MTSLIVSFTGGVVSGAVLLAFFCYLVAYVQRLWQDGSNLGRYQRLSHERQRLLHLDGVWVLDRLLTLDEALAALYVRLTDAEKQQLGSNSFGEM